MKIRSSLEVKQKNGEFVGAFAPYGYKKSPDNKTSSSSMRPSASMCR